MVRFYLLGFQPLLYKPKNKLTGLLEPEIWSLFDQILSALSHLHALKILHRDIKSKNVFLDKNQKNIKLGDFGIARQFKSRLDLATTSVGTPNSMSPEVCSGKPYSWSSDMWSLGCLLYEMATSKYPFQAPSLPLLLTKITTENPEPFPSPIPTSSATKPPFSKFLHSTIHHLLSKNPADRPSLQALVTQVHTHLNPSLPSSQRQRHQTRSQSRSQSSRSVSVSSSASSSRETF
ncbi:kinase-like domain-containing protein [Obelidium mucronatum]|nr:kinase-like domain-containing protein [Obelidium mucronatum]